MVKHMQYSTTVIWNELTEKTFSKYINNNNNNNNCDDHNNRQLEGYIIVKWGQEDVETLYNLLNNNNNTQKIETLATAHKLRKVLM